MLLSQEDAERMRAAIEENVVQSIETDRGECVSVDDETGKEWGHKWRSGETRVCVESDDDGQDRELLLQRPVEYVFAVRVVLVAVETY